MLAFALAHARILAFRPYIMEYGARHWSILEPIANCVDAALTVVKCMDELVKRQQLQASFWVSDFVQPIACTRLIRVQFNHYVCFCAVVVLYVQHSSRDHATASNKLSAAARCVKHLRSVATPRSLSQRYVSVIDALHAEAVHQPKPHPIIHDSPRPADSLPASVVRFASGDNYATPPAVISSDQDVRPQTDCERATTTVYGNPSTDLELPVTYWNSLADASFGDAGVSNWMDFDNFVLDPLFFE